MDVIFQLFLKHISPERLEEYRLAWKNITSTVLVLISKGLERENVELNSVDMIMSIANQSYCSSIESNEAKNVTVLDETNLPKVPLNDLSHEINQSAINLEDKKITDTASYRLPVSCNTSSEFKKPANLKDKKLLPGAPASKNVSTQVLKEPFVSYEVKTIPSGSNVEGANIARLFCEANKSEVEVDIMYQIAQVNTMSLEQCNDSNPMFVHICFETNHDVIEECVQKCGDDFHKLFECNYKKSKLYLKSGFLKSEAYCFLEKSPNFLKCLGGYTPCTVLPDWNSKDAAGTFTILFSNDPEFTGKRESNPQDTEKHVINEVVNVSPGFKQLADQMLQKIQQIQDSFLESRSNGNTKLEQIHLAVEWSKKCLLLTDTLCDHRQETIGHALRQLMGFETKEMTENTRTLLKKKFNDYLIIFNKLFNELDLNEAEKKLRDFETDVKSLRCLTGLNMFLQQELLFMNFANVSRKETEDLKHSANELLNFSEKNISRISIDLVFCLKCNFWPEIAAEWPKRERKWPDQATIENIVTKGIHIVCKELQHSDIDWRLSFSVAEIEIAQLWTIWQRYIYFIFKSLFYKYLKPLSNDGIKVITSYLVKTVMLNVSENFQQSWWCKENAVDCLNVLLMTLISAFESKLLQHHFVPTFNLLKRASSEKETAELLDTAAGILNSLLLKPEEVASNCSATLKIIEEFINVSEMQKQTSNRINKDLLALIEQSCLSFDPFTNTSLNK